MSMMLGTMMPTEIEIGPFTYDVSLDEADIDELAPEAFAAIDPMALLIALEPAQGEDQMRDSLLHEILHGIVFATGVDQDIDAETIERLIRPLSTGLLDVLRRNPAVVAFLVAP